MSPDEFITKWQAADLKERAACQEHFLDLCRVLGEPSPATADPSGSWFTFEKGVVKSSGGKGFADVWRRGCFGWEYKGKRKSLADAYQQLSLYRESLENPPLLIVCDLEKFEIHTNFTGTVKEVHSFVLEDLRDAKNLAKLRNAFLKPDELRPGKTQRQLTEEIARKFVQIADGMRERGIDAHRAGHFLMKLMFCMFAEDIELLPKDVFLETVKASKWEPAKLVRLLGDLFRAMANRDGFFGSHEIPWVNGGLFNDSDVLELTNTEIRLLQETAEADWSNIEPSIFGTLFERILNPEKRSQLGAHYTSREDILTLLVPVLQAPLCREWDEVRRKAEAIWEKPKSKKYDPKSQFEKIINQFLRRLADVVVLDPACGSGNFLYVALHLLMDLEKEVITFASRFGFNILIPGVTPKQLRGIELNPYAQELAQVVIWIGYLQWSKFNGFRAPSDPVLDKMDNIENRDAILDRSDPAHPKEPDWPDAEFIVGNPPFLGNKLMRSRLGDEYVTDLWALYGKRIPAMSDLVSYWFEKARAMIEAGKAKRAGLIATTGVKQVAGRRALERICESGRIFYAESDRDWVLDGASVRIIMAGFEGKSCETSPVLDGQSVSAINADLTSGTDATSAGRLAVNMDLAFMGTTKVGAFDIEFETALQMLDDPNPNGKPNSDLLRPFVNGSDLVQYNSGRWIIDCGVGASQESASLYTKPFEHLVKNVEPQRSKNGRKSRAEKWWLLGETIPAFRTAVAKLARYVGTARVAKHRVFVWLDTVVLPDSKVIAIAFDDDFHFGVLHSRVHQLWTLKQCGWHGVGNDATYNPNTCFLTFPFPTPTDTQKEAIAAAAKKLDELRATWCNPPEWVKQEVLEFPGSIDGPWKRYVTDPDSRGIGTVKYPRLVPKDNKSAGELKKRTLTNLYNERPTWLVNAHAALDAAVFAAYGWPVALSDDELLAKLLELNLSRAARAMPSSSEAAEEAEDEDL
jgi:type II restriction/modification system DNA methylase subunit YeeA